MVAERGRMTALWIAGLMLVTILPATAPTAVAGHPNQFIADDIFTVVGTTATPYANQTLGAGVTIRVVWTFNGGDTACGGAAGQGAGVWEPTALVDATDLGLTAAETTTTSVTGPNRLVTFERVIAMKAPGGVDNPAKKLTATITWGCSGTLPPTSHTGVVVTTNDAFDLDTVPPALTPSLAVSHAPAREAVPDIPATKIAAIGSSLTFSASSTEAVTLSWDPSGLIGGTAGFVAFTSPTTITPSQIPSTNGETKTVILRATDAAGNHKTEPVAVYVDNVAPIASQSFQLNGAATLTRVQPRDSFSDQSNTLKIPWTGTTGASGIEYAKVNVFKAGSTAPADRVAALFQTRTGSSTFVAGTNGVDNLAPYDVAMTPVDKAGNGPASADLPGLTRSVAFPTMTTTYGLGSGNPESLSNISNVVIAVTGGKTPLQDLPAGPTGNVWAELARQVTPTNFDYYEVDSDATFVDEPQRNTNGENPTTVLRKAPQTGTSTITLDQLASIKPDGTRFPDGTYYLTIEARGAADHILQHVLRFTIDGHAPTIGTAAPFAANHTDTAPVFSQVHGMDGNPFWAVVNATDRAIEEETVVDSGLRNLTVQLIDAATKTVVQSPSSGKPAQVDIRSGGSNPSCITNDPDPDGVHADNGLPYCVNYVDPGGNYDGWDGDQVCAKPADPATQWSLFCQLQDNISNEEVPDDEYSVTHLTKYAFHGWVNKTFPGLPVGNYIIRIIANDHAGAQVVKLVEHGRYRVAPAVRVLTNATLPSLNEGGDLSVVALASEYSNNFDNRLICRAPPGNGLCASDEVQIYVSTTASGAGVLAATLRGAAAQWLGDTETVNGYGGTLEKDGTLIESKAVPLSFYRYTDTITAAKLAEIGITGSTLFVRAVAISNDTTGAVVSRATDWIPVSRPGDAALTINLPAEVGAYYLATDLTNPAFNVTYDGKNKATPPVMRLWINQSNALGEFTVPVSGVLGHDNLGADRTNNIAPQYIANWSGPIPGTRLSAGVYKLDVQMFENRSTDTGDVRDVVANKSRTFVVTADKPWITIGAIGATSNLVQIPTDTSRFYSKSTLTLPIRIHHGTIPTPDVGLLNFTLKPSTGAEATLYPGYSGFTVSAQQTGVTTAGSTPYNLNVNLPLDAVHGGIYTLLTRVDLGAPANVGNPGNVTTFVLDKAAPYGALLPIDTELTLTDPRTPPDLWPVNHVVPFPTLVGYAIDNQSGIASVEVRIVDLTLDQTIRLDAENNSAGNDGYSRLNGVQDVWASNGNFTLVNGTTSQTTRLVYVNGVGATVNWFLPLWRDNSLLTSHAYDAQAKGRPKDMADATGWIDYSHQYRIDVRARDKLGTLGDTYSTIFDFDGASPFLGHSNRLNTTADVPSGIVADKKRVNWHSEGDNVVLSVNVTDNNCLKAVRIVGNTSRTPTPAWANMTAIQYASKTAPPTAIAPGAAVCPPRDTWVKYQLNLRDAPQLANDIAEYTYWVEAEDTAGQISSTPVNIRFFKMEVLDNSPASVRQAITDPDPGQAGGRALVRAHVVDNNEISHVTIELRNDTSGALIANGTMRRENTTPFGIGWWIADTTEDMNATLLTGNYRFNITAFDVFWNRSVDEGGPTCRPFCFGLQPLYQVRDDGAPTVQLVSPANGSSIGTSPTITLRAQHKAITASQIVVRVSGDGTEANLTAVPASELNLSELLAPNGSMQGWTVVYKPTNLTDNQTILVNFTASIPGLTAAASYTFHVDASAPEVTATASDLVTLAGKDWGTRATRVAVSATDSTAGALTILYSVNGAPQQTYTAEIDPSGDGDWRLEYWATDASGNSAARKTLNFTLDERGPSVTRIPVSDPDEVLVNAVDTGVGLNESMIVVHYRYGTTGAFSTQKADKVSGSSFRATLPGDANETGLQYYVTASDLLDNEGANGTQSSPIVIGPEGGGEEINLPPTISISAPLPDTVVNGSVTIRWLAEDPEQGRLTVSIAIKSPNPRILVTAGENTGSYVLNLAGAPGGVYTVVVTVNDGKQSVNSEVTFTVVGEVITIPNPTPSNVTMNTPVSVAIVITPVGKTIDTATFRVLKDGAPYLTGTLTPVQGRYIAQFTPTEPGAYTVFADVSYTDSSVEAPKQVAAFTVPAATTPPGDGGTAGTMPTSIIALVALAVLTIAGAAYGAFGRWKK